ncbi:unnamed protein product [Mycena citricolor]|uniref:DUF6589 domain-containing protein n=1 Tax=Mycena citricolor TaxID=2018698 RepID=A0AAD2H786_9AGAR|nr:unnamed protein product [Mycena citricolor]
MSTLTQETHEDEEMDAGEEGEGSEGDFSDSDDSDYDPLTPESVEEDEDDPEQPGPAIQVERTACLRAKLSGAMVTKVWRVLEAIKGQGIDLPIFLDALSWGDAACNEDATIRYACSALLHSTELPGILERWYKPPRPPQSKKGRPKGARKVIEHVATLCMEEIIGLELEAVAPLFESLAGKDVTEEELTGTSLSKIHAAVKRDAPNLLRLLMYLARTPEQRKQSPEKNPDKMILTIIAMFQYTRSHHRARIQKLFSVYFKFKGLSAKGFDTIHAIGLTMSSRWTSDSISRISATAMKDLLHLIDLLPHLLSYDNAIIPYRVFSTRIDNQSLQGNSTACTVYVPRNAVPLSPSANRAFQETRAAGLQNPLTAAKIIAISRKSESCCKNHIVYLVLDALFQSTAFDLDTYTDRDHALIQRPDPVWELPCGKEHVTLQYLLGTVNIPEASYEDNAKLITEWLRQLKMDTPEKEQILGLEKIMFWIGDQLTVDRLRNLTRFRAEDDNSFDRLDRLITPAGWLHICMAFANSIHKQHLGTSKGHGLSAAFEVLQRKGLQQSKTQGPFFHDLDETLDITAAAQIQELWLHVAGVSSLSVLRSFSGDRLAALAQKILDEHASSRALVNLRVRRRGNDDLKDEFKEQSVMFLRDVLPYLLLRDSIARGDVGLMEDMIPQLIFRFAGGNNSKYTIEMLELLQGLRTDWPQEVADFVRKHCWVLNNTGRRMGHMPIDEAQEMNIKDIKVTHRSQGPKIDWKYLKKLHPAIHIVRAVSHHMENEFKTRVRGWKHTVPKKEGDITAL